MELGFISNSVLLIAILVPVLYGTLKNWLIRHPHLPKGSFGLPWVGETLQLASSRTILDYALPRMKKYGSVFTTYCLGEPTIFVTDALTAQVLSANNDDEFKISFAKPVVLLFGPGLEHSVGTKKELARQVSIVAIALSGEKLAEKLPQMSKIIFDAFSSWADSGKTLVMKEELRKLTLNVGLHYLMGVEEGSKVHYEFAAAMTTFASGLTCLPIDLPGFHFRKCIQARNKLHSLLRVLIDSRKKLPKEERNRVIDNFMALKYDDGREFERQSLCEMFSALLLAVAENTSTGALWTIKYCNEDKEILNSLTMEHTEIIEGKSKGEPLVYKDVKNMKLATQCFLEALRLGNPVVFTTKRALKDVKYRDFVYPKGCVIQTMLPVIHLNSKYFPNPEVYDPSRFKDEKPANFFGFGKGTVKCPAAEFATTIGILICHYMTTNFRFERVGNDEGFVQFPFPQPKDGLRMRVFRRQPFVPVEFGAAKSDGTDLSACLSDAGKY